MIILEILFKFLKHWPKYRMTTIRTGDVILWGVASQEMFDQLERAKK